MDQLAQAPLIYQPGKGWVYSLSMDIQGYIVEKLSGQSLPDFMHDHIFAPLGMKDAGFYVPADKRSRFSPNYFYNAQAGELRVAQPRTAFPPTTPSSPPSPRAAAAWWLRLKTTIDSPR